MTFYYYDSAYLSAVSVMTAAIAEVELFLDMSGNGKIDGYYNTETGYFIERDGDVSLGFLDPGMNYNELYFQPVPLGEDKYAQYFMKVYYNMNPRSLIPDEGTDTSTVAQVLPAFVSTITEGTSYELLTEEQKAYRYIISGMTQIGADGELFRSSDNHVMYGPEASARSMVDVPLGGDISPAKLNDEGTAYTWTPNYQGNLLYPFENPEPIIIEESLAGNNIPIAEIEGYENGQVVLEEGGVAKLNGYLGSLTANNTVALAVQEQKDTTEEIAKANGVTIGGGDVALQSEGNAEGTLAPESVTPADSKITPDARYLQEMGSGNAAAQVGVDMNNMMNGDQKINFDYPSSTRTSPWTCPPRRSASPTLTASSWTATRWALPSASPWAAGTPTVTQAPAAPAAAAATTGPTRARPSRARARPLPTYSSGYAAPGLWPRKWTTATRPPRTSRTGTTKRWDRARA